MPPQPRTTSGPWMLTGTSGSGRVAGPRSTLPVAASNRLPWHGHATPPLSGDATVHPSCVHTAETPCTPPDALRVMTTPCATMPPALTADTWARTVLSPPVVP